MGDYLEEDTAKHGVGEEFVVSSDDSSNTSQ